MFSEQYIGSTDAARLLHINRSTLSRWVKAGKITPVARVSDMPTSAHLFARADLEALAASHPCAHCARRERVARTA